MARIKREIPFYQPGINEKKLIKSECHQILELIYHKKRIPEKSDFMIKKIVKVAMGLAMMVFIWFIVRFFY